MEINHERCLRLSHRSSMKYIQNHSVVNRVSYYYGFLRLAGLLRVTPSDKSTINNI